LAEAKPPTQKMKQDFAERMKGKPTPTQEENDLAALGAHFTEHEADGSDPDPNIRHVEASKPQDYKTRQMGAAPTHRAPSRE